MGLFLALSLLFIGTECPGATYEGIKVRLRCDREVVAQSQPLLCTVTLETSPSAGPVLAPGLLLPFDLDFRPRTLIEFEAETGNRRALLKPSESAGRGKYDLGRLEADSLVILPGGRVYGFIYDLNGGDWMLPRTGSPIEIRARIRIDLLSRDSTGQIDPAVRKRLGRFENCADSLVLNGEWTSNWVRVRFGT
jgi:hypothetical protein